MVLSLLLACAGPKPSGDTAPADTADSADTAAADTADSADTGVPGPLDACAPDHAPRAAGPLVIDAVHDQAWSFTRAQLDTWLADQGLAWAGPATHDVKMWRVRYTTQDHGDVAQATALLALPIVSAGEERATVLWNHGGAGLEDVCAPSAGPVEGVAPMLVAAARGYVVVAPDGFGRNGLGEPAAAPHPFLVGEPTAYAAVDALRAAAGWLESSPELARVDRSRVVFWGWSEGGYAALLADRYVPGYAPELAPVGVIAAVPPLDLVGLLDVGAATYGPATTASALMLASHAAWNGLSVEGVLQPAVADALPAELAASCTTWPSLDGAGSVDAVYDAAFLAAVRAGEDLEPWTCLLARSSVSNAALPYTGSAPVLLVTAEADTLLPAADAAADIGALCDEGYTVEHVACAGMDHADAPAATLRRQVEWLDARMRGDPVAPGCALTAPAACEG